MLPDVDSPGDIEVRVAARTGFRTMVWSKNHKQLALIHAIGDHLGDGDWAVPVNDLTQTLLSSAEVCAYGYIKRGTSQARARNGYALAEEWPEREGHTSHEIRVPTTTAFYDEYAPDAFGSQLLGPGYAGRVPPAPSYGQRPVADTVMLEHEDLAAWYEHPFVPATFDSRNIAQAPVPPVLANARAELAPILFRPDVIPGA